MVPVTFTSNENHTHIDHHGNSLASWHGADDATRLPCKAVVHAKWESWGNLRKLTREIGKMKGVGGRQENENLLRFNVNF